MPTWTLTPPQPSFAPPARKGSRLQESAADAADLTDHEEAPLASGDTASGDTASEDDERTGAGVNLP